MQWNLNLGGKWLKGCSVALYDSHLGVTIHLVRVMIAGRLDSPQI